MIIANASFFKKIFFEILVVRLKLKFSSFNFILTTNIYEKKKLSSKILALAINPASNNSQINARNVEKIVSRQLER